MHDADLSQVVSASNLEVVRVVSRGDLHAAGTKLFVYIFIRNHRDLAVS